MADTTTKLPAPSMKSEKTSDLVARLLELCRVGQLERIKQFLLERNYEKRIMSRLDQKSGKNGFLVCAEDNILEIIELMAENKVNINLQGEDRNTAAMIASRMGYRQQLELLSKYSIDWGMVGAGGNSCLHFSARWGHLDCAKFIMENAPSLLEMTNEGNDTALTTALTHEHFEVASLLLEKGANINYVGNNGNTPLSRAAFDGRVGSLNFILKNGGSDSLRMRNVNCETPVLVACKRNLTESVAALVAAGACIDDKDLAGKTGLMYAVMTVNVPTVRYLLEQAGADVNATDCRGYTSLMFACLHPQGAKIIPMLLKHKAMVNAADRNKYTALVDS
jgi:ankyrin repeat protein